MNITSEVITDLLPLYFSGECSADSKALVDDYFTSHPKFAEQAKRIAHNPVPVAIPHPLTDRDEMSALKRTRRRIKRRSYLMGFAIFCSLAPFSFIYTNGKFYWLMSESPTSAVVYLILGAALWVGYFVSKYRSRDI